MNFNEISQKFQISGNFVKAEKTGSGHINETYLLSFDNDEKYVLQKINHHIFTNIEGLMNNIELVLNKSHKELKKKGLDPFKNSLTIIKTKNNKSFIKENGNCYRIYNFISDGIGYDLIEDPVHFYESGLAFGSFQKMLDTIDIEKIEDTIPNFHNTKLRYEHLLEAIKNDKVGRVKDTLEEINFFKERTNYLTTITDLLENKLIPYRVTHNDTKLNNVLINPLTNKAICVIDLDTIMKGSIAYDFGDAIRFGANEALEDEKDLSKVKINLELFEQFTKGFLKETKNIITPLEKDNLVNGALLMTLEVGIRFLTDHLNGDVYFNIKRENHNLDRARTQIKLVKEIEKNIDKLNAIVNKYS